MDDVGKDDSRLLGLHAHVALDPLPERGGVLDEEERRERREAEKDDQGSEPRDALRHSVEEGATDLGNGLLDFLGGARRRLDAKALCPTLHTIDCRRQQVVDVRLVRGDRSQDESHHQDSQRDQHERQDARAGSTWQTTLLELVDEHATHGGDHKPRDQRIDDARGRLKKPDDTNQNKDHPNDQPRANTPPLKPPGK